ncbi:MAG: single-stranded-DNA-specific exonuclease RecJ [Anaerotruncus massiliensis (ex Togo et al. 2019)]
MDKAVARIRRALSEGERIAVYGDYDCDGIMSTVVLYSYLESAGADVCYYIPQRDREGYGLNREALKLIHDDGVRLVITVDNGITAIGEVEYASSLGLDVVITDHHKPREVLPAAAAVVDPHRLDDESGCEYLAGVGVAFKLICALEGDDGELMLDQYGDLVAVATVADIVPLTGENRTIVRRGLESLQNTDNEGLAALIRVCGMADKQLSCENIAYGIVPRINSAGRFDCVDNAIELFVGGGDEPEELAGGINSLNEKRRAIEDQIVRQIMQQLESDAEALGRRVIVIYGEGWHHGIVGIVASRMVERFGKPCIVLSVEGENARARAAASRAFDHRRDRLCSSCSCAMAAQPGRRADGPVEKLPAFIEKSTSGRRSTTPRCPSRRSTSTAPSAAPAQRPLDPAARTARVVRLGQRNARLPDSGWYPQGSSRSGAKHLRLRFAGRTRSLRGLFRHDGKLSYASARWSIWPRRSTWGVERRAARLGQGEGHPPDGDRLR